MRLVVLVWVGVLALLTASSVTAAHPPSTNSLRADVAAVFVKTGSYLLLDNLPWRYWKGTSVAFTVR